MLNEDLAKISKFFLLSLRDVKVARDAAVKTSVLYQKELYRQKKEHSASLLVKISHHIFRDYVKKSIRLSPATWTKGVWEIPSSVDLNPWLEFQKTADIEYIISALYVHVLKLSTAEVAAGLKVSPGTVSFRAGKGLVALGALTKMKPSQNREGNL